MKKYNDQEKVLNFMKETMSIFENKQFQVQRVDLCSTFSHVFPNDIVFGYLFIIGDEDYFREVEQQLSSSCNHTLSDYVSLADEERKALFLKYDYVQDGTAYHFKNINNRNGISKFDSRIDHFLYLVEALEQLDEKASYYGGYTEEAYQQVLEDMKKNNENKRYDIDSHQVGRRVVKQLNKVLDSK